MSNCDKFPACESCINKKFDPFQCVECVNASNYEKADESFDDEVEELSFDEFRQLLG